MCPQMQSSGHTPDWSGPSVERVMRNGKRIYVLAFKTWRVEQASRPGVSVAGLALRHGVNANQLRRWMKLRSLQRSAAPSLMLPVSLIGTPMAAEPTTLPPPSAVIEIELAGALIRVREGVPARQLRIVIEALRA
jgi:transposase